MNGPQIPDIAALSDRAGVRDGPVDQDRPRWAAREEHHRGACFRARRNLEAAMEMSDDRIARLLAELDELPSEEREKVIAALSDGDRAVVLPAELEATEAAEDDAELGGEA